VISSSNERELALLPAADFRDVLGAGPKLSKRLQS
jgi:hypothetical protein